LFDGVTGDHNFELTDAQRLGDGSIRMVYRRTR
jgi:hypothetical protein